MQPRGLTNEVTADWDRLAVNRAAAGTVDVARLPNLPDPVRRWLAHALPVDGRLPTAVELRMHGQIRIGTWRRFSAVQGSSLADGFVWTATARMFGLPIVPAVALDARVTWEPINASKAHARFALGGDIHEITVTVGPFDALEELVMRWGNPAGGTLGFHVFGAALRDEATFDGVGIPPQATAGWHYGTDQWDEGAFIRWTVNGAHYN